MIVAVVDRLVPGMGYPVKWCWTSGSSGPIPCEWLVYMPHIEGGWLTVKVMSA